MARRNTLVVVTGLVAAALTAAGTLVYLNFEPTADPHPTVKPTTVPVTPFPTPTAKPSGIPTRTTTTTTDAATPTTTTFRLRDGQVVYRAPSPMRVNEVQRVTVRVAGEEAPPELTSGLPGTGSVSVAPAKVGSALTADLSGPDFQISRVGGDDGRRELPDRDYAEWAWDVRPQKSGKLRLDFVLYVAKDTGGVPVHYRTYAHEVEVDVNFPYSFGKFVKDYGAITGLSVPVVVGAAGTFFVWLRKKKRKKTDRKPVEEDTGEEGAKP